VKFTPDEFKAQTPTTGLILHGDAHNVSSHERRGAPSASSRDLCEYKHKTRAHDPVRTSPRALPRRVEPSKRGKQR
jgi:hypothetical protein